MPSCLGLPLDRRSSLALERNQSLMPLLEHACDLLALEPFGFNSSPVVFSMLATGVPTPLLAGQLMDSQEPSLLNLDGGTKAQDSNLQLVLPEVVVIPDSARWTYQQPPAVRGDLRPAQPSRNRHVGICLRLRRRDFQGTCCRGTQGFQPGLQHSRDSQPPASTADGCQGRLHQQQKLELLQQSEQSL